MITQSFKGYIEGRDISKIPMGNLAYPSKNVIVTKNKVVTRGGIENDGTSPFIPFTTAATYPGTVTNTDGGGGSDTGPWTNPDNVKVDDGTYAFNSMGLSFNTESDFLDCSNFGFAIPTEANITGVKVEVECHLVGSVVYDKLINLIKGGVAMGNSPVNSASWSTTDEVRTYDHTLEEWGVNLTPADVNASDFGVRYQVENFGSGADPYIDYVRMTVSYTLTEEKIHSEFVWKDAAGGVRPIRCTGQKVQVKYNDVWYTIFESLSSAVTRVIFATWVDSNGAFIKKRLFFVDGSSTLYQWNGAIGVVESADSNTATIAGASTCVQLGFDDGTTTNQTLLHFIGSAVTANSEEAQNNNPTGQDLEISGAFNTTPVAGDVIIAKPVAFADKISATFMLDAIYSYKNHIVAASYDSVSVYFSHIATYALATGLDFTMPASASRTALTAILMRMDGNFTAMISRDDVLWISDADDWYKVRKLNEVNAYDLWVEIEKFETGERKGALPMACAKYKGDIIYMAQDKTLQRVTSVEILGTDEIRQLSDDVEDLFNRLDMEDIRLYYIERAIYIICPMDSTLIILDMIEGYFQPPQILPINCMSIIDGVKYGHHNAQGETYTLFSGRNDLGTPIEGIIAFGLYSGDHSFRYKKHSLFGISCRLTLDTNVLVEHFFEENGAKTTTTSEIEGSVIKTFAVDDDVSWATHPYAERSWGGADMEVSELRRAMVFDKFDDVSYFDYRVIMTVSGDEPEFHLLGWFVEEMPSARKIGNDLFIQ